MRAWKQTFKRIVLVLLLTMGLPAIAQAAQAQSTHYQVNEVFFGAGGELNACSANYCSKQSAGDLVVGETCSATYCAHGGFNTDRTPYIECTVSNANIDLGKLDSTSTKTASTTFTVKSYLSHGYTVVNASDPPTNNAHQLAPITGAPQVAVPGTEQFGINLVANTSPAVGADPLYIPDNTFSFGAVTPDYSQADHFKYETGTSGGTIAFSNSSSSDTTYTISYIFNISPVTPGGTYTFDHVIVATGTY